MSEEAFLRLSRRFFLHPLWTEDRPYSRAEAWLDCLRKATWEDQRQMVDGNMVDVKRGGLVASVRYLAKRWSWSKSKVCVFLDLLEQQKMIRREKGQGVTVIHLCNYEKFNPKKDTNRDTDGTPKGQRLEDVEDTHRASDPPGFEPPVERFIAECERYLVPAWYAEMKWEVHSAKGWASGRTPIRWKEACRWVKRDFLNDGSPATPEAAAPRNGSAPPKPVKPLPSSADRYGTSR